MVEEAEKVALDMLCKVNRRAQTHTKLDGNLLIIWEDLKHTMSDFCHAKRDDNMTVIHLEDYLKHGVADGRDIIVLEKLEECYKLLRKPNEANRVRRWREESSWIMSQENYTVPPVGEKFENDRQERKGGGEYGDERSSEGAVVDEAEKRNEGKRMKEAKAKIPGRKSSLFRSR